jgi:hypothetical protein
MVPIAIAQSHSFKYMLYSKWLRLFFNEQLQMMFFALVITYK